MSESEVFAANLRRLIDGSSLSERQLAERSGVSIKTLARWLQFGLQRPARRPPRAVVQVAEVLDVPADALWESAAACACLRYAERLKNLINRWERLGIDYQDSVQWIDSAWTAARVVERFCRDEGDLAGIVAKVKSLRGDAELQSYLENLVREWKMDETESYKRLVESTHKFVVAMLPPDPDQMGSWFRRFHPRRWANLLARRKLDDEAELAALIRNLMAEGLSLHEAYEALVRLSD